MQGRVDLNRSEIDPAPYFTMVDFNDLDTSLSVYRDTRIPSVDRPKRLARLGNVINGSNLCGRYCSVFMRNFAIACEDERSFA